MRMILILAGLVVVLALGVLAYLFLGNGGPETVETADTPVYAPATPAPEDMDDGLGGRELPTFDIVRVDRTGEAVIAGRASPGETVQVFANDALIGEAMADARGEWTMIVTTPLDAGDQEITLTATNEGGDTLTSDQVVVVAVPEREGDVPLVVLSSGDAPSRVLQAPQDGVRDGVLALNSVDYDDAGNVIFAGEAEPGAPVRVYVGDESVGAVRAGPDGGWSLEADRLILPGLYTLRVDMLAEDGSVLERVEVPFERATPEDIAMSDGRVVVQPGNSLWRISRAVYGEGLEYTIIYQANQDQIRDPDLIYPGQIFDVPTRN